MIDCYKTSAIHFRNLQIVIKKNVEIYKSGLKKDSLDIPR